MTPTTHHRRDRDKARGTVYGAYHRVSRLNGRDPDSENYITEAVAFEQMQAWGTMRGVKIADHHYLDRDVSGSKTSRPALDRMLADLRAGVIDGVVVAQVDRLSRADVGDALKLVAEINEIAPGRLAILDLGIDPTSDTGEMMLGILLSLARWQWKRYRTKWADAQSRAVARGVWIGAEPFGYRRIGNGTLEPHPTQAKIVREAFKLAAGSGLHAAMSYLMKVAPERVWTKSEVRRVLSSRVYLGEVWHGKHKANTGAHKPLTTLARFTAAQTEPRARRSNGDYPLSGIAECHCGKPMVGALQTVGERKYRRMRCSDLKPHNGSAINADNLESFIREELDRALSDDTFVLLFSQEGEAEAAEALAQAESDRDRWVADDRARDVIGDTAWYAGLSDRAHRVDEAREHHQAILSRSTRTVTLPGPGSLHKPGNFECALQAAAVGGVRFRVRGGRGSVEDRVRIVWPRVDSDDSTGVLAA
jgi:DNA invertase Pin-like site-specific DNA recombinase